MHRGALVCSDSVTRAVAAVLCCALFSPAARAQATQYKDAPPLLVGAAWYPEQWDEATADRDLESMEVAHIHLARVAEFAAITKRGSKS